MGKKLHWALLAALSPACGELIAHAPGAQIVLSLEPRAPEVRGAAGLLAVEGRGPEVPDPACVRVTARSGSLSLGAGSGASTVTAPLPTHELRRALLGYQRTTDVDVIRAELFQGSDCDQITASTVPLAEGALEITPATPATAGQGADLGVDAASGDMTALPDLVGEGG